MTGAERDPGEAARDAIRKARQEIDAIDTNLSVQLVAALIGWLMRWSVWFALIFAITFVTSRYEWLWPLGTLLAATALAIALSSRIYVHRSAARKRETLDAFEARLAQEETRQDAD